MQSATLVSGKPNTMKTANLIEQFEKVKGLDLAEVLQYGSEANVLFTQAYFQVYGVRLCANCGGSLGEKFRTFTSLSNQKIIAMSERKFKLKANQILYVHPNTDYTNENLTDEIAEKLLRKNPGFAAAFETMPEGFAEELQNASPEKDDEIAEKPKKIRVLTPEGKNRSRKIEAGDLAYDGEEVALDGEYKIKNEIITVVDGKVIEIKPAE